MPQLKTENRKPKTKRVICIVLDGCGAGAAPDAKDFGDFGKNEGNTLRNVWNAVGGFDAPNLTGLGYLAAGGIEFGVQSLEFRGEEDPKAQSLEFRGEGIPNSKLQTPNSGGIPNSKLQTLNSSHGRLREISIGKDTVTGHWEMMGIHLAKPFPTYPKGFPIPLIKEFEERIGMQTLGNEAASGTDIINRLGEMHVETGCPIVYTSADSVFQIACHEEVIPVQRLYEICKTARELLVEPDNVGRVIARPFTGDKQAGFKRTENRKDFPLSPPTNLIDKIADKHGPVFGIGVIPEVFCGRGFREVRRTQDNKEHYQMLLEALESDAKFIWANFEDTDMLFGHRNDPIGFAKCLEEFDVMLGDIISKLRDDDLLIITADHGNDPTTPSTDHSREYIPVATYPATGSSFGDKDGFWCIGATIADALGVDSEKGESLR